MIDVQNGLGIKNMSDLVRRKIWVIFEKNDLTENAKDKYIKPEYEITKKPIDNKQNKYARSDIMDEIFKNCRGVKKCNDGVNRTEKNNQRDNFRSLLGFKENEIYQSKEYSTLLKIKRIFPNEIMSEQCKVNKYFIDLVFAVHKLGIEIDENGHTERPKAKEEKRTKIIKEEAGSEITRINPDKENFDIFDEIGKIQEFISDSNKKLAKTSLKGKLSLRLLSLEFKSNDSVKTKCLRHVVKKILSKI